MAKSSFKPVGAVAITVLARLAAKKAVQDEMRAQGIRVSLVKPAEVAQRAKAYLDANPSIYEEALLRAWKLGLVDHSERLNAAIFDDDRRGWRKPRRPVAPSDHAKTDTDIVG